MILLSIVLLCCVGGGAFGFVSPAQAGFMAVVGPSTFQGDQSWKMRNSLLQSGFWVGGDVILLFCSKGLSF